MKNKYLLVLFFIIRCLFLNADIAFGNSIYNAKDNNLNILLKKYDISLAKPEIIPVNSNINKKKVQRRGEPYARIISLNIDTYIINIIKESKSILYPAFLCKKFPL